MFPDHHDRLSCSRIAARIQLHVDGEDEDSASVDEHLRRCQSCADEAALYAEIKTALARPHDGDDAAVARLAEFTRRLAVTGDESPAQPED